MSLICLSNAILSDFLWYGKVFVLIKKGINNSANRVRPAFAKQVKRRRTELFNTEKKQKFYMYLYPKEAEYIPSLWLKNAEFVYIEIPSASLRASMLI